MARTFAPSHLRTVLSLLLLATVPVCAQQDFGGLKLGAGDVIYVIDASGAETRGVVASISAAQLSIAGRDFRPVDTRQIDKRGDALWDGALIGSIVGAGVGALLASGECGVDRATWQCTLEGAAWGTLVGTLIDWRHAGRTTIFVRSSGAATSRGRVRRSAIAAGIVRRF